MVVQNLDINVYVGTAIFSSCILGEMNDLLWVYMVLISIFHSVLLKREKASYFTCFS